MPTTRLMQFSSAGASEEAIDDNGLRSTKALQGVSSTHFLRLIEDRGRTGFWSLEYSDDHMTISVGLYRLFGIDPSTPLVQEDFVRLTHPDDRAAQRQMYETLRSGHATDREVRIIRPDGTMRWLQNKAEVVVDAHGRPARAVGVMIDVTEQHAARRSVEDGWYRYKTLVEAMAVIEYGVTASGEFTCKGGWYDLTGQTADEASGGGWLDAVHPEDRELTKSRWVSALATGSLYAVDSRFRCQDGQYRRFLSRCAPVFTPDGTIREWIGTLVPIVAGFDTDDACDDASIPLQASHSRAARALLNWTIDDLAARAGVSVSSVRRLETGAGPAVRDRVLQFVRETFEENGISFSSAPQMGAVSIRFKPV